MTTVAAESIEALAVYQALSRPPQAALKTIGGGRLKGMTDIKPQWRVRAMTEMFGLCGIGWKYTIDDRWTEPGPHGDMMVFVQISLYVKSAGEWSDAIPAMGGSAIIDNESSGLRADDEGYKMALTDALSVAMAKLGVAAEIYMGAWDGTKYKDVPPPAVQSSEPSTMAQIGQIMTAVIGTIPAFTEVEKAEVRAKCEDRSAANLSAVLANQRRILDARRQAPKSAASLAAFQDDPLPEAKSQGKPTLAATVDRVVDQAAAAKAQQEIF